MHALYLTFFKQFVLEAGIEYRHLEYLNEQDIADAIKKVGPRAEFREKLFKWRRKTASIWKIVNMYLYYRLLINISFQQPLKENSVKTNKFSEKVRI